ncbi:MAG: hypothetical protein ACOCQ4_01480, partial [bacterium]
LIFKIVFSKIDVRVALAICLVTGIFVFWGQEKLLDYFVDRASETQKDNAQLIMFFSQGLNSKSVDLANLPESVKDSHVQYKSFVTLLGFVAYTKEDYVKEIRKNKTNIALSMYGQEMYREAERQYKAFNDVVLNYYDTSQEMEKQVITHAPHIVSMLKRKELCNVTDRACNSKENSSFRRALAHIDADIPFTLDDFCWKEKKERTIQGETAYYYKQKCYTNIRDLRNRVHELLQEEIKDRMGRDNVQRMADMGIELDFTKPIDEKDFRNTVMPFMEAEFESQMERNFASVSSEDRDNMVRATIVPPFAIAFSLIFAILNFLRLARDFIVEKYNAKLAKNVVLSMAGIIIIVPLILGPSLMVGGFAGMFVRWVIFMETIIYWPGRIVAILPIF